MSSVVGETLLRDLGRWTRCQHRFRHDCPAFFARIDRSMMGWEQGNAEITFQPWQIYSRVGVGSMSNCAAVTIMTVCNSRTASNVFPRSPPGGMQPPS